MLLGNRRLGFAVTYQVIAANLRLAHCRILVTHDFVASVAPCPSQVGRILSVVLVAFHGW
jgi:hypothetical protein